MLTLAVIRKIWQNSKHPLIALIPGGTSDADKALLIRRIFRGQKRALLATFPTA